MVHRNILDVDLPKFLWHKLKETKKVNDNVALDTETIGGRCFLIADSKGNFTNDKSFVDLIGLLQFLNLKRYRTTNNWFYNLEYDTNAILHFLSFEERQFIAEFNYIDVGKYRISIIPKKELKISILKDDKLTHTTVFYDLAQFYNFKTLKTLAETTDYEKVFVSDIAQIDKDKYYTNKEYFNLINDRCVIDAKIARIKADELTDNINKIVKVNTYRSKASIARKYVLSNIKKHLKMPTIKILDCALKSYHAGHIETCQIGLFKNVYNYDLKSAYPAVIANLYETNGQYLNNTSYEPDTAYSFYLIRIDYDNPFVSPLWFLKSTGNYHVTGKLQTWVTQPELEFFMNKGYDFTIIKAHHIKKNRYTEKPFYNIINDLYNERLKAKDNKDEIELVYKVILNSIYGVTLNTIHKKELSDIRTDKWEVVNKKQIYYKSTYKATNMYNPVYGAFITAGTRATLFNDFYNQLDKIISINTDGVYMLSKSKGIKISNKLGDYGYKKYDEMMFMGSGRYFIFNNKELDNKESRFRSVSKSSNDIYDLMLNNQDKRHLTVEKDKPIKLKESVKNSKYYDLTIASFPVQDFSLRDQFNVFNTVKKDITFYNNRRYWYNEVDIIKDLWDNQYESRPFNVRELL